MRYEIDSEAIRQEIEQAHAQLATLRAHFPGEAIPPAIAKVEQAIKTQLETAESLLNS